MGRSRMVDAGRALVGSVQMGFGDGFAVACVTATHECRRVVEVVELLKSKKAVPKAVDLASGSSAAAWGG